MVFLAVSTLEKLKKIPPDVWLKLGAGVLVLILAIVMLRKLAQVNKVVLFVVVMFILSTVGFSWIYERNEPKFLTPLVDKIAPFFPGKGSYGAKQQNNPKGMK